MKGNKNINGTGHFYLNAGIFFVLTFGFFATAANYVLYFQ